LLLYPVKLTFASQEEKGKILKTLEMQRFAFNEASKVRFSMMKKNSIIELHQLFYSDFRKKNPNILADIVVSAQNDCLASYKTIKSNKQKIESPVFKKGLSIHLNKNLCKFTKLDKSEIKLSAIGGKRITAKLDLYSRTLEYIKKYDMKHPSLYVKDGEIYLGLVFDVKQAVFNEKETGVGIDLGIRRIAATSEGKIYQDKGHLKRKRAIRFLKRKLRSVAQTKKSKSAKRRLKKLRRKEHNQTKNFVHHLSKKILTDTQANVIILEDLSKIKERKGKRKYQNINKISQVLFYQIKQFLTYKAPLYGKRVEVINPANTSKIDWRTGQKDGVRNGCRYYGKDGIVLDAELNAANNIAMRSKLPASSLNLCQGLDGQAVVNRLIVGNNLSRKV
jgi:IS605 OrfB family transposase